MPSLAMSPLAPVLGQRVPLRGPARLLYRSYARTRHQPGRPATRLATAAGDVFDADLSSLLEWQLWAFGSYESHFPELLRRLVRPGDRCVDVGANVGVHAIRLGKLTGPAGEVIAIEPDPGVAQRARRNIALNGLGNVRVVNAAASDRPGQTVLYRPGDRDTNRARASLLPHPYLTGPARAVPVITVDDACDSAVPGAAGASRGRVALIKIDVEGHEAAVVRGAARVIGRDAPAIIFEYAPDLLADDDLTPYRWLAGRGYQMYRIRAVRHGLTGRVRLALERLAGRPAAGGNILAVTAVAAASLRPLPVAGRP
jgi:FkbM family methyltransferase